MTEKYKANAHIDWLKVTGRWDAFRALAENYKAAGMPPGEANQKAWEEVRQELPGQGDDGAESNPEALPSLPEVDELPVSWGQFRGNRQEAKDAINWVMANLQVLNPKKCPSTTAWSLLAWARKSKTEFMKMWLAYQPKLSERDLGRGELDDEQAIEFLRRFDADEGAEGPGSEPAVPAASA